MSMASIDLGSITAELVAHVSGYHPMVEAARLACGIAGGGWQTPARRGAILMFIAFEPCTARKLEVPERIAKNPAVIGIEYSLPADNVIRLIRWTSQRTGYIGVIADNDETAVALAREFAADIRIETLNGDLLAPMTFGTETRPGG